MFWLPWLEPRVRPADEAKAAAGATASFAWRGYGSG